ncbi:MAG: LysR family transcriptional regulator [Proteobacteria bacterium]|nr:LysR family transcriptional regulator [Pseudomonadota bacterium]
MELDVKLMRYAVVLSRHRHFGRAAKTLGISQPALSRGIATLERKIGVRVFERSRRDVTPTPAGEDVLRMADELVARLDGMSNRLKLVRDGREGRLRVASGAFVHDIAVRPAAAEFIQASPAIRLELLEREWHGVLETLMSDRADFAIMDPLQISSVPTLRVETLGRLQASYVCRAGHPLLDQRALQVSDFARFPFVATGLPSSRVGLIKDLDSGASIDTTTGSILPSIAVSSCRSMFEIAAATDAITLGHPSQIEADLAGGRLAILDVPAKEKVFVDFAVVYKRERTLIPAAKTFIALLRRRLRQIERKEARPTSRR